MVLSFYLQLHDYLPYEIAAFSIPFSPCGDYWNTAGTLNELGLAGQPLPPDFQIHFIFIIKWMFEPSFFEEANESILIEEDKFEPVSVEEGNACMTSAANTGKIFYCFGEGLAQKVRVFGRSATNHCVPFLIFLPPR